MYIHESSSPAGWCFRMVREGEMEWAHGGRRLRLDEDCYLIAPCTPADRPDPRVYMLHVDAAELQAAWHARAPDAGPPGFLPCLRPRDEPSGHRLAALRRSAVAASDRARLLDEAIEAELALRARADRIDCVKPSTRAELFRRVLRATDVIESRYDAPLGLAQLAEEARLSRFHLLRQFSAVWGTTPHAYLMNKRARVAARLLRDSRLALADVAAASGFGHRCSLYRHLHERRSLGEIRKN